jgi:hypothetical protein
MASPKKNAANANKTSWGRILGAVGTIALVIGVPFLTAHDVIDRALVYTFGVGNLYDVRGPRPTFSGFQANDVKMNLDGGSVLIRRVRVETGFIGMVKNAFTLSMDKPVDNVAIIYEDIRNPEGFALFDEIGAFGPSSASLFEAEGCGENAYWSESELSTSMGLSTTPGTIKVEFSQAGNSVINTTSFSAPGAGTATFIITAAPIETRNSFFGVPQFGAVSKIGMTVSDDGFIKARNNYCAQITKVSVEQFIENHIASIKRMLVAGGAKASDELLAVYREYATNGGDLEIDIERNKSSISADPSLGEVLVGFKGEIRLADKKAAYSFEKVLPMDWPAGSDDKTPYQVLVAENSLPVAGTTTEVNANADGSEIGTVTVRGKAELLLSPEIIAINRVDPEYLTSFGAIMPYKGRRLRFERNGKPYIDGYLIGPSKGGIRIRVPQPGGYAEIELPTKDFKRAILFPNRG